MSAVARAAEFASALMRYTAATVAVVAESDDGCSGTPRAVEHWKLSLRG